MVEAVVETHGDEDHQVLQVEEVGGPGGGLMLTYRGDDGDVLLGVGGVEKGHGTTTPSGSASNSNENENESKNCGS